MDDSAGGSRRAQESLHEQATMLLNAQRVGHMGSWTWDSQTGKVFWSDATCEIFGITPEQFEGTFEHFLSFVLSEDLPGYLAEHARPTPEAPQLDAEYRIARPDGSIRWMSERGTVTFDDGGKITGRIGMVMDVSEQKRVADQLGQNSMLARVASRVAQIGGWTMNLADNRLTWSDETCAIHDVPPGYQPTVDDGISMFPDEYRDRVRALVRRCIEEGTPYEFELPKRTATGRLIWVRSLGEAVRDASGRVVQLQGAFQDITARRQAEAQAQEKDLLLRFAGQIARIGGWAIELPNEQVRWSDEVYAILELEKLAPMPLQPSLSLYREPDRGRVIAAVQACRHKGEPFDVEAEMETGRGRVISVRVCGEAVRDHTGVIIRMQGAIQDLTQLRSAQQAARESNERLGLLSRASNDAIWDWDIARDTIWCNENFAVLCGPDKLVCPESWKLHIHPADRQRVLFRIDEAMEGSAQTWSESYRIDLPDGRVGHVSGRGYITRDGAGHAVRMVGSITDISERLALEERLRQTQRLESVGQLTGGVAHDFNNLLTVILGNAEVLNEELVLHGKSGPLQAMARAVMDAAQRGAELTQRLLAFARKQALEPKTVDINLLVSGTDAMLRRTLGEHIHIEFVPEPRLWAAEVDPAQLDNTLLNLCLNARDAMPQGGRLRIETANVTLDDAYASRYADVRAGAYVMLSVSDTGFGIEPQHLGRVFEPFYTTKEQGKGTGLGLAMTYGFMKQSGGHVNIESQPGRGTTVRLYLPPTARTGENPAAPAVRVKTRSPGGEETILLVEDDELVRKYANAQLMSLGYTVLQAPDGAHALELLGGAARLDLLFTDVVMPGMSGRELADQARLKRPGLRVLYTSGYAENMIVHDGRLDAGIALLAKPYRRDELAQSVRRILDDKALLPRSAG